MAFPWRQLVEDDRLVWIDKIGKAKEAANAALKVDRTNPEALFLRERADLLDGLVSGTTINLRMPVAPPNKPLVVTRVIPAEWTLTVEEMDAHRIAQLRLERTELEPRED